MEWNIEENINFGMMMEKSKNLLYSVSGHARSYKETLDSHLEMIIAPLSFSYNIDVRFLLYDVIDFDKCDPLDEDFIFDKFKDFDVDLIVIKQKEDTKSRGITECMFSIIQDSLQFNDKKYDFLVRSRPDLRFNSPINSESLEENFDIAFPCFANWLNGRNDQFFILNSKDKLENDFVIFEYLKKNGCNHPETFLKKYVDFLSLREKFIDTIDYVIVRPSGEVNDQRNFYRM